jgi:hypothetical protein
VKEKTEIEGGQTELSVTDDEEVEKVYPSCTEKFLDKYFS